MMNAKNGMVLLVLLLTASTAFAELQATISELSGKVEIKVDDSAVWKPATVGAVIEAGTTISTGFKSVAVLKIGETRLTVKALTRLSLKDLVEKDKSVSTDLFLSVGKVRADVRPIAGKSQTFNVGSPISTASVRGTGFDFDGVNLKVDHGEVAVITPKGHVVPVSAGEGTRVNPGATFGEIQAPLDQLVENSEVRLASGQRQEIPAEVSSELSTLPGSEDTGSLIGNHTHARVVVRLSY